MKAVCETVAAPSEATVPVAVLAINELVPTTANVPEGTYPAAQVTYARTL